MNHLLSCLSVDVFFRLRRSVSSTRYLLFLNILFHSTIPVCNKSRLPKVVFHSAHKILCNIFVRNGTKYCFDIRFDQIRRVISPTLLLTFIILRQQPPETCIFFCIYEIRLSLFCYKFVIYKLRSTSYQFKFLLLFLNTHFKSDFK